MARWLFAAAIIVFAGGLAPMIGHAHSHIIKLATLNWEPYTGEDLPGFGATSTVVTDAFSRTENGVEFKAYSWNRAIAAAWHGRDDMLGYFPGYHCHHNPETSFVASKSIGQAPLGFVFRTDKGMPDWKNLEDLHGLKIGYVTGYASTDEFERLEQSGVFTVYRSMSDESNLQKLLVGQLDAVLIDGLIFQYLLQINPVLSGNADLFEFHRNSLGRKDLYVCFRDDDEGRRIRDEFDKGLEPLDSDAIMNRYFREKF